MLGCCSIAMMLLGEVEDCKSHLRPVGQKQASGCTLIDVGTSLMETELPSNGLAFANGLISRMVMAALLLAGLAQPLPITAPRAAAAGPPPSTNGVFSPIKVRRGMTGTAWTALSGR